jgi:hypothetical protein
MASYNRYKTDFNDLEDERFAIALIGWGGSFVNCSTATGTSASASSRGSTRAR